MREENEQPTERKTITFEDLEVWQYCSRLCKTLTEYARTLPIDEKYKLADQIIRAARSVTNNIAEGYGRYHYRENIQFCRQSRGSLYELMDHLIISFNEGYIQNEAFQSLRNECLRGVQLLNGYIRFLSKELSKRDAL
jgi:four helix bundle protein